MKKIKLLLIAFIISLTYSCSTEDNNIENENLFNKKEAYEKVINSENPKEAFENYNEDEKAKLWEYKYELFINKSKLTENQISIIKELKDIAIKSITEDSIDDETFEMVESKVMQNFENSQFFDLLYFLDNPSLNTNTNEKQVCFWCTMYETTGPCHSDGHGGSIQSATFYNCRFWHCSETNSTGTVPCQD